MKVALVSLEQIWENKYANLSICEEYIKEAFNQNVELILFPEMTLTGYSMNTKKNAEEEEKSFTIKAFQELALKNKIAIVFGVVITEDTKASNRLYFIDEKGIVLDNYSKIHPFTFANEDKHFNAGNIPKIVEYKGIKIGLSICYDLRFSNLYKHYTLQETDCIINIANWPAKRIDHWNTLLKARAIENQQFIIGVNRTGKDENGLEYVASSDIYDAIGQKLRAIDKYRQMEIYIIENSSKNKHRNEFNTVQDIKEIDGHKFIKSKRRQNILFRADSSSFIGTGHIMRDLVLAKQYKSENIIFAVRELDGNINYKIDEEGYTKFVLQTNDFEELDKKIKDLNIDMLVIDHYEINYDFEKRLKEENKNLKIFVFDDTYEKHYCDILLNHNISADKKKYKGKVPKNCELRCGAKYTLLRDEFIKEKKKLKRKNVKSKVKTIFLAMGGSDAFGYNLQILKKLEKYKNIKVIVATTTANKNIDTLRRYTFKNKWVKLHINSNKIAKLMGKSSFCIVTPSVTISEVIFLKKDFIAIKVIENQDDMYKYLRKNRYCAVDTLIKIDKHLRKYING